MDTARDSTGKTGRTRGQRYCLQLISGRSLDQIMLDFVIHEFIARRRRIEELARGRSNMEGEVLQPRHRKRARMRRQHPSPRPVCYYVKIRVVICLFNPRYWWAESVCMCVRKRFKRVVLLVLCKTNKQTNKSEENTTHSTNMIKHMRITDFGNEIPSVSPRSMQIYVMFVIVKKGIVPDRALGGLGVGAQRYFKY